MTRKKAAKNAKIRAFSRGMHRAGPSYYHVTQIDGLSPPGLQSRSASITLTHSTGFLLHLRCSRSHHTRLKFLAIFAIFIKMICTIFSKDTGVQHDLNTG